MIDPYSSDDRNADNPFAYYETVELPVKPATTFTFSDTEPKKSAEKTVPFEPRTPFDVPLLTSGDRATLTVSADRCEFSGDAFDFPLEMSRDDAAALLTVDARRGRVRLIHDQFGERDFKVPDNPRRELQLARLEVWWKREFVDGSADAAQAVTERMEVGVTRRVLGLMIAIPLIFSLPGGLALLHWIASGFVDGFFLIPLIPYGLILLVVVSLTAGIARGQIWAMQTAMIFSYLPAMGSFFGIFMLPFVFVPVFILAVLVSACFIRTENRYLRQLHDIEVPPTAKNSTIP